MNLRDLTRTSNKIGEIYGAYVALGLIAYFWLALLLGLINVPELRLFNLFIQTAGIYYAYKQFRRTHDGHLNYFRALSLGFIVSTIGTSAFCIFLFALFQLNPGLFENIIRNEPLRAFLTPYTATIIVWTEGIISGTVATYALTNVMDTDP